jgi:hypothetical protein
MAKKLRILLVLAIPLFILLFHYAGAYGLLNPACNDDRIIKSKNVLDALGIEHKGIAPQYRVALYERIISEITTSNMSNAVLIALQDLPLEDEANNLNQELEINSSEPDPIGAPEHILYHFTHEKSRSGITSDPRLWKEYWLKTTEDKEGIAYIERLSNLGIKMIESKITFEYEANGCRFLSMPAWMNSSFTEFVEKVLITIIVSALAYFFKEIFFAKPND